jgi:hypothetical protein
MQVKECSRNALVRRHVITGLLLVGLLACCHKAIAKELTSGPREVHNDAKDNLGEAPQG